jgi:hypothetical protein
MGERGWRLVRTPRGGAVRCAALREALFDPIGATPQRARKAARGALTQKRT